MKKHPAPTARTTRRPTTTPAPLPPIVAAVARFIDPGYDGVHPDFLIAWTHMPAVVASHVQGDEESIERESHHSVIGTLVEADLARSRGAGDDERYLRRFAELTDMVNGQDDDALTTLTLPHVEAAFRVGIAFACYVLMASGGPR